MCVSDMKISGCY